ncbi:MAG: GNAT family N-acetyltransferase [Solirubrobacteraceae bacterium]
MTTLVRIDDPRTRPISATLHDGSTVAVRPLDAQDASALRGFLATVSIDSLHRRFHGWLELDRAARALSEISTARDWALVVQGGSPSCIVAHAAWFRTGAARAEVAFLVADAWQGRGLGSLLFASLVDVALVRGVSCLVAEVLPTNRGMLRVFERSGHPISVTPTAGALALAVEIEIGRAAAAARAA